MSLAEKTRPQNISDMVLSNKSSKELSAISTMIKTGSGVKAILLIGPSGYGKTTAARIFARQILLPTKSLSTREDDHDLRFNLLEVNAANTRGIDAAREIATFLSERNMFMQGKVAIIDEAQQMTKEAQNCILKPMEDNPHSCVIICTTDPGKIIKTIKTRCVTANITALNQGSEEDIKSISDYLNKISASDGYLPDPAIFRAIAKSQPNSIRAFINKAEQLSAAGIIDNGNESDQMILGYTEEVEAKVIEVVRTIVTAIRDKDKQDLQKKFNIWKYITASIQANSDSPETIRIVMCKYIVTTLTNMNIKTPNINSYNAFIALGDLLITCTDVSEVNMEKLYAIIFKALFGEELKR